MTRRERIALVAAIVAVPFAIAIALFAVDVLRTSGWMSSDDARFRSAPLRGSERLWNEPGVIATRARFRALGMADDLDYRRTVARFERLQPGKADQVIDPAQEGRWAKLQFDLTAGSRETRPAPPFGAPEPHGRPPRRFLYASPDERSNLLTNAIGAFRTAVELDPGTTTPRSTSSWRCARTGRSVPVNAPDAGGAQGKKSGRRAWSGTEAWASLPDADRGGVRAPSRPSRSECSSAVERRTESIRAALRLEPPTGRPTRSPWHLRLYPPHRGRSRAAGDHERTHRPAAQRRRGLVVAAHVTLDAGLGRGR